MSSSENENYERRKIQCHQRRLNLMNLLQSSENQNNQEIAEGGQTGINTEEAKEKYKKQGMTKT